MHKGDEVDAKSRQRTQTLSKHSTQPWPSEGKRCNKVLPRKSFPESVSRKWRVEMAGQTSGKIGASACQRGGPQGVALMQFHTRSRIISASCADHRCRPQGGIQVGIRVCFCACDCGVALGCGCCCSCGKHPGSSTQEAPGKHLGSTWEAPGEA